jgi:biopolymer transport protein TolR
MMMSRRAKRMDRHHARSKGTGGINLVSLMDIFTILVFFLLVNSSDGEVLPTHKSVKLPESISEEKPRETVTIMVNAETIMLHGNVIASVESLMEEKTVNSQPLTSALKQQYRTMQHSTADGRPVQREATIMGDREIPYRLLKKVMASCAQAGFDRISLAVLQKPLGEG